MKIYNTSPEAFVEISLDPSSSESNLISLKVKENTGGFTVGLTEKIAKEVLTAISKIRACGAYDEVCYKVFPNGDEDSHYLKIHNIPNSNYCLNITSWDWSERQGATLTEEQADLLVEGLSELIDEMAGRITINVFDCHSDHVFDIRLSDSDYLDLSCLEFTMGTTDSAMGTRSVSITKNQAQDLVKGLLKLIDQMGEKDHENI